MANVYSKNAYNILGLETNASFKEINRRAGEIIRLLNFNETEVEDSINLLEPNRTLATVTEALNNLASPKAKIRDYFFWFDSNDETDKKFIKLIKEKEVNEAVNYIKSKIKNNSNSIDGLLKLKNLVTLQMLLLLKKDRTYLDESLTIWEKIIASDKFWNSFERIFEENNGDDIETVVIQDFRADLPKMLADVYLDASSKDKSIYSKFRKHFKAVGRGTEKTITKPALNAARLSVEKLENMNISEDGIMSQDEVRDVSLAITNIQVQLNKLDDYGLYDDSEAIIIRDKAATAIRGIAIDIHNQLGESEKGAKLIEVAIKLTGTKVMERQLKEDLRTLNSLLSQQSVVEPIDKLIEAEEYSKAITSLDRQIKKTKANPELLSYLHERLKVAITLQAAMLDKEGWEDFKSKSFLSAEDNFIKIEKLVMPKLHLFTNFSKESLINYLDSIEQSAQSVNASNLSLLDNITVEAKELANKNFEGTLEAAILSCLIDAKVMPYGIRAAKKANAANIFYVIGWLTIWFWGIGIIFLIIGWIYKNSR